MRNRRWRNIALFLLSLTLHIGGLLATYLLPPSPVSQLFLNPTEPIPISVEFKSSHVPTRDVVPVISRSPHIKTTQDDRPAKHLSAITQRVEEETVAPHIARQAQLNEVIEQERSRNQEGKSQTKPQSLSQQRKEDSPDGEIESKTKQNESQFQSSLRKDLQRGQGNYFGQGKFGSMTALNTDRFEGFSFYRRVEESTRSRWDDHVENAINQLRRHSQTAILSQPTWTTQVEFLLDREGNLRKAYVIRSSGLVPFDVAATQAFKDAATFPNPPKELIAEDGYVHLNFIFNVHLNPGLAARGSE